MTLLHEIWNRQRHGGLVLIPHRRRERPPGRDFYCLPEIYAALELPQPSEVLEARSRWAWLLVERFVHGGALTVRAPPSRDIGADLALLEEAHEDVWEFRFRGVEPQLRIFGRFAGREKFVALLIADKAECHTAEHYRAAKETCKKQWRRLFAPYPPYHAASVVDYLGNVTVLRSG